MADSKTNKSVSSKKIDDVKKGGDAASGTSRQVIVNNRPIARDPMMAQISELTGGLATEVNTKEPEADTKKKSPSKAVRGAPEIIPNKKALSEPSETAQPDAEETPQAAPALAPSKKKIVIKPLSRQSGVEEEGVSVVTDKPVTTEPASTQPDSKLEVATKPAMPKSKDLPELPTDDAAPEKKQSEEDAPAESNLDTASKLPAPTPNASSDKDELTSGTAQPGRSFEDTEAAEKAGAETANPEEIGLDEKGKAKKVAPTSGQLTIEQQKAVDNGEYFLPITTSETRRLRREIVTAVIFVMVMIIVWLDVMLDAGLLKLGGIHALTNFF